MQGSDANSSASRRESDIVLPKWQPDHEATHCPVCHTEFGMFYRRHHCRKCGRVVCATCSPHRITIPRQYIVQPPNPFYEDEANPGSPGGSNPALGGGEVVRVCNPCVPDPWTPDSTSTMNPVGPTNTATNGSNHDAPARLAPWDARVRGGEGERPDRYRHGRRDRSQTYQNTASFSRDPRLAPSTMPTTFRTGEQDDFFFPRSTDPRLRHRYSQSGGNSSGIPTIPNRPPPTLPNRPPPPPPIPTAPTPRVPVPARPQERPRREVREEDECPVCGTEMPPGEALREAHIQECIAARFSSTPSQQPRSAPPAAQAIASAPPPREATSNTPEGSRPRATSYRPRGMALYRATEKDCTTEDGEPQECVICFEEFEEGDEMGRMECLCKFHRACIRQWWNTKGQGSCPTHQLHD